MSDPAEVKVTLVKARNLINNPAQWIRGEEKISTDDGYAFCAIGAVREVVGGFNGHRDDYLRNTPYIEALSLLEDVLMEEQIPYYTDADDIYYDSIVEYNDSRDEVTGYVEVVAIFDKAIERAAAQLAQ